jgi:hypothetical protein
MLEIAEGMPKLITKTTRNKICNIFNFELRLLPQICDSDVLDGQIQQGVRMEPLRSHGTFQNVRYSGRLSGIPEISRGGQSADRQTAAPG